MRPICRWHEIGDLSLGEIAPLAGLAEHVVYDDISPAGLVQAGHDIDPMKPAPPVTKIMDGTFRNC